MHVVRPEMSPNLGVGVKQAMPHVSRQPEQERTQDGGLMFDNDRGDPNIPVSWPELSELRARVWSFRSQLQRHRAKLRRKQVAKFAADDLLLQTIYKPQLSGTIANTNASLAGARTVETLMDECQNTRDELGSIEGEYFLMENKLFDLEYDLVMLERHYVSPVLKTLQYDWSKACDTCGSVIIAVDYYHCNTCPGLGYDVCFSCAENGLSCPSQDHSLMKRTFDINTCTFVDEQSYTTARGLRVLVKDQLITGIGDTGSEETIISDKRRREMGEHVTDDPMWITLGNGRKMFSMGTVKLPIAFPDSPDKIITVIARVVKNFSFDILLGNAFLQTTQTMQKYLHRFTRCLFSTKNLWSFYRIGETSQRFHATMGNNNIPFAALADTGSCRNVMSADWAFKHGLKIKSELENLGWITFPVGPRERTIGQVHTWVSLPNGKLVATVFDVLPSCRLPVVLGIDFVLDNDIYQQYAGSFSNLQIDGDSGEPSCMGMGRIPWFVKVGGSIKDAADAIKSRITSVASSAKSNHHDSSNEGISPHSDTAGLKRQLEWDETYDGGKTASVNERNAEIERRRAHERVLYSDNQHTPIISLIPHTSPNPASTSGGSAGISTGGRNGPGSTETAGLITVRDSLEHNSTDETNLAWSSGALESTEPVFTCTTAFGQMEVAQWQA